MADEEPKKTMTVLKLKDAYCKKCNWVAHAAINGICTHCRIDQPPIKRTWLARLMGWV